MSWYVLQVAAGEETRVRDAVRELGIEALAPMENRMIRSRGQWVRREYQLFRGYVFVNAVMGDKTYYQLRNVEGVLRILASDGRPAPLTEQEARWVQWLGDHLAEPSVVEYLDGTHYRIVSGVLKQLEPGITRMDRHHRRAQVRFTLLGEPRTLDLTYRLLTQKTPLLPLRVDSSPAGERGGR